MPTYKNDGSLRSSGQDYPEVMNQIRSTFLLAICISITGVHIPKYFKKREICVTALLVVTRSTVPLYRGAVGCVGWVVAAHFGGCLVGRIHTTSFFPQDAIVIHEVYEEGAAARDGRLWAGDQILEVNESLCVCVCFLHLCCVYLYSTQRRFLVGKIEIIEWDLYLKLLFCHREHPDKFLFPYIFI